MGGGGKTLAVAGITFHMIKQRLFTKEDWPHNVLGVHKLLGIGVLLHYMYRFVAVLLLEDMGFGPTWQTAWLLGMHTLLSVSSMIFKIPKKRIIEGSRIWPEYRLHSIIFACRSLSCMALIWTEQRFQLAPQYGVNVAIILGTIFAADVASWSVGEGSRSSTIRDLDAPPALQFFFSVMQFHATAGCLLGIRRFSTQFVYVWVIQFTAFLMTLRRKNLAPHAALVRTYGVMLTFGFVIATVDALSANSWALVQTLANTAAVGRLGCRLPKYGLWAAMAVLCHFGRKTVAGEEGYAHLACVWPYTWALSVVGVLLVGQGKLEQAAKQQAEEEQSRAQEKAAEVKAQ